MGKGFPRESRNYMQARAGAATGGFAGTTAECFTGTSPSDNIEPPTAAKIEARNQRVTVRVWLEDRPVEYPRAGFQGSKGMKGTSESTGLHHWMLRVLRECDNVAADFSADPVHDLRVSLRRCRSLADGMMAMDPDRNWKAMKKAGKKLFQSLGALRDVQIMMEWTEKLHPAGPTVARALMPASGQGNETSEAEHASHENQLNGEQARPDRNPEAH